MKFETEIVIGKTAYYNLAKFVSLGGVIFTFILIASSTDFYPSRYRTTTLELSNLAIGFAVFFHLVFVVLLLISTFWISRTSVIVGPNSINLSDTGLFNFDQVEAFRIEKANLREGLYCLKVKLETGKLQNIKIFLEPEQKSNLISAIGKDKITWTL